jgi:PleD family two-component response regulator
MSLRLQALNAGIAPDPALEGHAMILLVDDQPIIGEAVRRALAGEPDIDFHYCCNPDEAVALACNIGADVVLLDLVMPSRDGLEVLRELRTCPLTATVPVVMLSVKEDAVTKSRTFALGANDYLVKLPDRLELLARLRHHARARQLEQQRDEAWRALRESQRQLVEKNTALIALNEELREALAHVKQLEGLLPICSYCKRIREDGNYWKQIEEYIGTRTDARFSHGICPDCQEQHFGPLMRGECGLHCGEPANEHQP